MNSNSNNYISHSASKNLDDNFLNTSHEMVNQDVDSFIKYISEKIFNYEDNVNLAYINLKMILTKLEEEFPQIDISCFSEFFVVCEEFFSLIQHSKTLLDKSEQINKDNEKLRAKTEKTKQKKLTLKSLNTNLKEENLFKDEQIRRIEEELSILTKDYLELYNKMNQAQITKSGDEYGYDEYTNTAEKLKNINNKFLIEIKNLTDDKHALQKENSILTINLEKLENDLKQKYMLKNESEKIVLQLEGEKNALTSKLKILEVSIEKLKREVQLLKSGSEELKKELEKSAKKLEDLVFSQNKRSSYTNNYNNEYANTPLDMLLDDEEDEEEDKLKKKTFSKLNRNFSTREMQIVEANEISEFAMQPEDKTSKTPISPINERKISRRTPQVIIHEVENDYKTEENIQLPDSQTSSFDGNRVLYKDFNREDYVNTSTVISAGGNKNIENPDYLDMNKKKTLELQITSHDIVNRMSHNDFNLISKTNQKQLLNFNTNNNSSVNESETPILQYLNVASKSKQEPIHINNSIDLGGIPRIRTLKRNQDNEEFYKEFFLMTYQSLKLNYDSIEPFLYVNR